MFDLNNIKGRIISKKLTAQKLAPMLGLSEGAIYEKLSGKTEFKRSEIERLLDILEINLSDIGQYFF